jgi:hypothetical protein
MSNVYGFKRDAFRDVGVARDGSEGISPIPITVRNISSPTWWAEERFMATSPSLSRSRRYSLERWRGAGSEWVFLNWIHPRKPLSFHPIPLCFNKVALARDDSSTLSPPPRSPDRNACPMGYERTHSTSGTWEIPTMQCARLFTFCTEENVKVSVSFCLCCTSSVVFLLPCLVRVASNRTSQLLFTAYDSIINLKASTKHQNNREAPPHVWRLTYLKSQVSGQKI